MFEALGSLMAIALVLGVVLLLIVKAASKSKQPPHGQPGAGFPPYAPGQYPQPGPYPPQGQWQPYPAPQGYQQQSGHPYPGQQGYPQQPGYPPVPQVNPSQVQGGMPPQGY